MATESTNINGPASRHPSLGSIILSKATKVRIRLISLNVLARRALDRLQNAKGARGKMAESARLIRKLHERLQRRAAGAIAKRSNTRTTRLADHIPAPAAVPECRVLGDGMFAITLDAAQGENPDVSVHDQFGNSCTARIVERIDVRLAALSPDGVVVDPTNYGSDSFVISARNPVQFVLQAPVECLAESSGEFMLHIRGLSDSSTFCVAAFGSTAERAVTSFSVDHDLITFAGAAREGIPAEVTFALFIDGNLAVAATAQGQGRSFLGSIAIGHEHFDGAMHRLELREMPHMNVLSSVYRRLPLQITPWNALQEHSRAPLDGTLSPTARHHLRSYSLWFAKVAEPGACIPPLNQLHTEILQGHRKRQVYPPLNFPTCDRPVVSVVIPARNRFEVTYLCLCSLLFAYNDTNFEVILVDDGSDDETTRVEDFIGGIRVLRHGTNRGFVDSCNDGAALAKGEYIAFLNNDVEATARWLDELVQAFKSFDGVGLAGSKLVYPDGRLQEAGGIIWRSGNPWNAGRGGNPHDPRYNYLREVDYVSGAAMLISRAVWTRIGGFSAEFAPGYFEDTDLAMKVREAGYRVIYAPGSTIIHFEGQSAGTSTTTGMKRFQEINRPKFKRKWSPAVSGHGLEGAEPDREKDRMAAFRVLFLDHQFPHVDADAGSYASFQEIRLFQKLGAKVTFLPRNLAWMDRHTLALQRIGVECLYAPYVMSFSEFIRTRCSEYDAVFICRHQIAAEVVPLIRSNAPSARILFNLADLHFLRELREADAGTPGYSHSRALETRTAELAVVRSSDLTFSYSDVELDIVREHLGDSAATARMPWIVEARERIWPAFASRRDLLFLGGFSHPPNAQAVKFFVNEVMPALRARMPEIAFAVAGSGAGQALRNFSSDGVAVLDYVEDLDELMNCHRVFVGPLQTGAGLKGKVIEAISRGLPCVLSPVAAEGTGLQDGTSCLIADTPLQWFDQTLRLYSDEILWSRIAANALELARTRYSFDNGVKELAEALSRTGLRGLRRGGLVYRHVRPQRYGW